MTVVLAIIGFVIGTLVVGVVVNLLGDEASAQCPRLAARLVRRAARRLPPAARERYEEEWLANVIDSAGPLSKLWTALSICIRASDSAEASGVPSDDRNRFAWPRDLVHRAQDGLAWIGGADPELLRLVASERRLFVATAINLMCSAAGTVAAMVVLLQETGVRSIGVSLPLGVVWGLIRLSFDRIVLSRSREPGLLGLLWRASLLCPAIGFAYLFMIPLLLGLYQPQIQRSLAADGRSAVGVTERVLELHRLEGSAVGPISLVDVTLLLGVIGLICPYIFWLVRGPSTYDRIVISHREAAEAARADEVAWAAELAVLRIHDGAPPAPALGRRRRRGPTTGRRRSKRGAARHGVAGDRWR